MHHYPFHIGDYVSHTRHLSLLEDLAYRRLLDAYYLREGALPADVNSTARLIGMREHEAEVKQVLQEFFELCDDGWASARADEEIAAFRAKQEQASRAGRASAQRRSVGRSTEDQRTFNVSSTVVEHPLNGCSTNQNQNQNQNQDSPNSPPEGAEVGVDYPDAFEGWWAVYPRKLGKGSAFRAWEKARKKLGRSRWPILDEAVAAYAQQVAGKDPQYIPHASTWLNGGRWDDNADGKAAGWYVPMASPAGG